MSFSVNPPWTVSLGHFPMAMAHWCSTWGPKVPFRRPEREGAWVLAHRAGKTSNGRQNIITPGVKRNCHLWSTRNDESLRRYPYTRPVADESAGFHNEEPAVGKALTEASSLYPHEPKFSDRARCRFRDATLPLLPPPTACGQPRSCPQSSAEQRHSETSPWNRFPGPGSWR